ncbi:MAG: 4-(cytidine 5'-diphospho)-2-C-methyl-D-erythritol kinase [Phycisphaerae bacterium]|nr:4-(cytidine 5'-diphospho)-2-C-methyl-D-erythritol kinase [Phycisphaerae bacterium]
MIQARVEGARGAKTASAATCAKINLTLDVLGKRSDGYHELDSVVIGVGLFDELHLSQTADSDFQFACEHAELATEDNLVVRAVRLVERVIPGSARSDPTRPESPTAGRQLRLEKRIPVGGGLGGGSGNAAGTLALLNRAMEMNWSCARLGELGAELGSDVPLFFHLPAARVRGRGERVEPVNMAWSGWVLLVHVACNVSTAAVYAALRPEHYKGRERPDPAAIARVRSSSELMAVCRNDLEPAVARVAPRVAAVQCCLRDWEMGTFRISGAGSVLYHLFDDEASAQHAAKRVQERDPSLCTYVVPAPVGMRLDS